MITVVKKFGSYSFLLNNENFVAEKMPDGSSKIVVPDGKVPNELEKQVSNAIADLESNSDIRAQLRELNIVGAKVYCAIYHEFGLL